MMKNINKNIINFSFGILAIFAVGIFLSPTQTKAEYAYYHFSKNTNTNIRLHPTPAPEPVYYQPAPVVYQPAPVYQNNTYSGSTQTNHTNYTDTSSSSTSKVTTSDYKNLTANAVFGTHSFLPSGLVQWVILAIFILVIVILLRRALGAEERYQSEPLKHA